MFLSFSFVRAFVKSAYRMPAARREVKATLFHERADSLLVRQSSQNWDRQSEGVIQKIGTSWMSRWRDNAGLIDNESGETGNSLEGGPDAY